MHAFDTYTDLKCKKFINLMPSRNYNLSHNDITIYLLIRKVNFLLGLSTLSTFSHQTSYSPHHNVFLFPSLYTLRARQQVFNKYLGEEGRN